MYNGGLASNPGQCSRWAYGNTVTAASATRPINLW